MTKIIYKEGDLTRTPEYIIVHGCNAQGKMNSGVAKAIRSYFPGNYDHYVRYLKTMEEMKKDPMGTICFYISTPREPGSTEKVIGNMITQKFYGSDGKRYVDYGAIAKCMARLNKLVLPGVSVAMPMIGAGLGGGDWKKISKIIEEESTKFQPVVYSISQV